MISSARKAVILLAATFVLGALVGAAGMAVAERRTERPRWERRSNWYLDHLSKNLDLSSTQRDSVGAVIARYRPVMDSLMQEIRPRLDTVRAAMRDQIASHLTPAQRQEYEEMRRHHEAKMRNHGEGKTDAK
jgi:Spy/CpxP family protein refolding chaperone